MGKFCYILQGCGMVTCDSTEQLITTGMTECIAVSLSAYDRRSNKFARGLFHFDGCNLYNNESATERVKKAYEAFNKCAKDNLVIHGDKIEVNVYGGEKFTRNLLKVKLSLEKLKVKDVNYFDHRDLGTKPLNGDSYMLIDANNEIHCGTFDSDRCNGFTQLEIENGAGSPSLQKHQEIDQVVENDLLSKPNRDLLIFSFNMNKRLRIK
ncbi:hypothetical protein Cyrtocomes_01208 [Candidatus Cyrtobacter comes]|uniref:Uncharacterized protein n=1 Tax=Candidatus Cyrtobacter comes TaxID=675776 RepID=A0ABU5L9L7_9RICK|nr:hypothetical protein [Candidatus Cyrtobacter comes]MDZ5762813.1 hypothetical protein [Candidatus Cyrtobacter comes]